MFLGIDLPDAVDDELARMCHGLPGARWEPRDNLHLTVTFLGEVDGGERRALLSVLAGLQSPGFSLALAGVGVFPPRGAPRVLWVGVDDPEPLRALKARVDRRLEPVGLDLERRKYAPHVPLARLNAAPRGRVAGYLGQHALYRSPTVEVQELRLYSSVLSRAGAKYRVEAAFPLSGA